jgi:hypothetical protein
MTKNLPGNIDKHESNVVLKKRGRKSKKEIEEAKKLSESSSKQNFFTNNSEENIVVNIEENDDLTNINTCCIDEIINSDDDNDNDNEIETPVLSEQLTLENKPVAKKRGRKPKGGKIIQQIIPLNNTKETKPNVILHLKCCLKDLNSSNLFGSNLDGFSFNNKNDFCYDVVNNRENINININEYINAPAKLTEYEPDNDNSSNDYETEINKSKDTDIRDIWKKLKILEHKLHINSIDNKKSACFWDTCEFDNPPIYIPKHFMNETYHVYGCFCSPECAVAHLMEENIDSSVKFERYHLMNHIYSKVYNYNKNIKPAPNPYYMLEKYYGNLSIQEYRSLLRNERLFLVVDKPLTRIMPELHEDNDDFIINNKIIPSNTYQIKKKIQKKQTKTNILSERFGLAQT